MCPQKWATQSLENHPQKLIYGPPPGLGFKPHDGSQSAPNLRYPHPFPPCVLCGGPPWAHTSFLPQLLPPSKPPPLHIIRTHPPPNLPYPTRHRGDHPLPNLTLQASWTPLKPPIVLPISVRPMPPPIVWVMTARLPLAGQHFIPPLSINIPRPSLNYEIVLPSPLSSDYSSSGYGSQTSRTSSTSTPIDMSSSQDSQKAIKQKPGWTTRGEGVYTDSEDSDSEEDM